MGEGFVKQMTKKEQAFDIIAKYDVCIGGRNIADLTPGTFRARIIGRYEYFDASTAEDAVLGLWKLYEETIKEFPKWW